MKVFGIFLIGLFFTFLILMSCDFENKESTTPISETTDNESIEEITKDFFDENPELDNQSDLIIETVNNFFDLNSGTKEFSGKKPFLMKPIYAYGIKGLAYYEIWLTENKAEPKGWILISATDKDFPVVSFSHNGIPYSKSLTDTIKNKNKSINKKNKIYRFGVSYYAMEDETGRKIADFGSMPSGISTGVKMSNSGMGDSVKGIYFDQNDADVEPIEGIHYKTIDNYESLKELYAENYYTEFRKNTASTLKSAMKKFSNNTMTRDQYIYRWVSGQQCLYTQIPANTSANTTGCWSGCNNNAWTSLFGWWDLNMGKSRLIPTTSTGETCPIYRNTAARRNVVDPVQMYFRSVCNTYCKDGGGWTKWKDAWRGYQYTTATGYGYSYSYQWCNDAGDKANLADVLTDSIANNYRPAHVGANSHFYVAYGWAQWDTNTKWTWVYCYPGWSENHNDDVWISWYDINSSTRVFVY